MSCDCAAWSRLDRVQRIAAELVQRGFIDPADESDCARELVGVLEAWGFTPRGRDTRYASSRSVFGSDEQRRIVLEYAKFAQTTNSPLKRSQKIRSLGVSPESMCRWARKHFGSGFLATCRPTPTLELIVDELRRKPWQTVQEIRRNAGVVPTSMSGALSWGRKTNRLSRRKRGKLWEYAAT